MQIRRGVLIGAGAAAIVAAYTEYDRYREHEQKLEAADQGLRYADDASEVPATDISNATASTDPTLASDGDRIARNAIRSAGFECTSASLNHMRDSVIATCNGGERYRVMNLVSKLASRTIVMKCSAAKTLGVKDAC